MRRRSSYETGARETVEVSVVTPKILLVLGGTRVNSLNGCSRRRGEGMGRGAAESWDFFSGSFFRVVVSPFLSLYDTAQDRHILAVPAIE